MIGEVNLGGVFLPTAAVCAIAAIVTGLFVRRLLNLIGVYRLVWHRGLFDLAMLIILWGSMTYLVTIYGVLDAMNLQ